LLAQRVAGGGEPGSGGKKKNSLTHGWSTFTYVVACETTNARLLSPPRRETLFALPR
jgi:hypothetical protein